MEAMRRGDLSAAWRVSDEVLRRGLAPRGESVPPHLRAVWDGTPLAGRRVRVLCHHGLGDTVQFIRFAPLLKDAGCDAGFVALRALLPLLRTADGVDRVLPLG